MSVASNRKIRFSSIELLRIIAMIMIVAHHFAIHTPWGENLYPTRTYLIDFLASFGKAGVAIFFLITGYFLATRKRFNGRKIWQILRPTWFYSLTFFLIAILIDFPGARIEYPLTIDQAKSLFPILTNSYWFITQYAIVFLLSPFLKRGLDTLNRKDLARLALILFFAKTIIRIARVIFDLDTDSSVFIVPDGLYFVILGYITWQFKNYLTPKLSRLMASIGLAGLTFGPLLATFLQNDLNINISTGFFCGTGSTFVLLFSVGLLIIFSNLKFQSTFVNYLAGLTLGVYLIHDNLWVRFALWHKNGLSHNLDYTIKPWYAFLVHAVITILIVFCASALIEAARQFIVRTISKIFRHFFKFRIRIRIRPLKPLETLENY